MIGRELSHYEFLEELGQGGMGVVYRARDVKLGREVAIKVLPHDLVADPESRQRFEQEARATAALEHPNIAVIHEIDEVEGVSFIVMELLRARTLRDMLSEEGLPPETALDLAAQVADGLSCAHASNIIHRDIKPGNLMISNEGHLKIIDFGLAKLIEVRDADSSEDKTITRLDTEIGTIVGTTTYMSPEQARSEVVDPRTDIFSLGIVLFEMLTGAVPFRGRGAADILSSVLKDPTPRIQTLVSGLTSEATVLVQTILDKCLAKDPKDRYPSAESLAAELREVGKSVAGAPAKVGWLGRWARTAVVAGVLAASVIFGLRWLELPTTPSMPSMNAPFSADVVGTDGQQRSVAVMGFRNLSGQEDVAWLSTALSEMLGTELAIGDRLRIISGEDVARMKADLALSDQESFARDTLAQIRNNLCSDFVVVGSYVALGEPDSNAFRLDVRLQDAAAGRTVQSVAASGSKDELFDIVRRTGAELREGLGVERLSEMELESVRASASSIPEATRLYAQGLEKLRTFDASGARALVERAIVLDPDFAQAHAALSSAWEQLGYDKRAEEAAERALALSEGLPRKQRLLLRALYQERSSDWAGAVETLTVLLARSPKNLDYGLRLAAAQSAAGSASEGLDSMSALRRLPAPLSQDPRIDLAESELAYSLADYRRAVKLSQEASHKALASGASTLAAHAMLVEGDALWNLGDLKASSEVVETAIELFEQVGDLRGVAEALNSRAILYEIQGNLSTAGTLYRESLSVAREIGDRAGIATALYNMATTALKQGELSTSAALLEESLAVVRDIRDPLKEAVRLFFLGRVALEKGDLAGAERFATDALHRDESLGAQRWASESLKLLSDIQLASGDVVAARETLQQALALSENIGHRINAGRQLTALGELLIQAGELGEASKKLEQGAALLRETEDHGALALNNVARATILIEQDRASEGEAMARESAGVLHRQGRSDQELRASTVVARALLEQGKTFAAQTLLERIAPAAERSESAAVRLAVTIRSAHSRSLAGDVDAARRELQSVLVEAEKLGFVPLSYEARLVLASVSEDVDLSALAIEAEEKGFVLTARKAARAAVAGTRRPPS